MALASARPQRAVRLAAAAAALLVLLALLAQLAALRGQDTDLFPRWYGLRQLLAHGRNPYGDDVSREIAHQIWFFDGRVSAPEMGRATPLEAIYGFLYPLPGALLLAPLALLPYPTAYGLWVLAMLVALPLATGMAMQTSGTPVTGEAAADQQRRRFLLATPLALCFLPTWANVMLGQPAPAVAFLTALAVWLSATRYGLSSRTLSLSSRALPLSSRAERGISSSVGRLVAETDPSTAGETDPSLTLGMTKGALGMTTGALGMTRPALGMTRGALGMTGGALGTTLNQRWRMGRPFAAGAALAAAVLLKPHLLALLAPMWLAYQVVYWWRGDRAAGRFVAGTALTAAALGAVSFALAPSWLVDFARAAHDYVAVGPGAAAVLVAARLVVPAGLAGAMAAVATAAIVVWALAAWRSALAGNGETEVRAIWRTLVATALVVPPAWETNGVMLLLPLAAGVAAQRTWQRATLMTAGSMALTFVLLPPYFVLGWQRGTLVIGAYLALLAAASIPIWWRLAPTAMLAARRWMAGTTGRWASGRASSTRATATAARPSAGWR